MSDDMHGSPIECPDECTDLNPLEYTDFSRIRDQCNTLVQSDSVQKDAALQILRLHHAMETIFHKMLYEKNSQLEALKSELVVTKLTHTHANAIDSLTTENMRNQQRMKEICDDVTQCKNNNNEVLSRLADLDARVQVVAKGRR